MLWSPSKILLLLSDFLKTEGKIIRKAIKSSYVNAFKCSCLPLLFKAETTVLSPSKPLGCCMVKPHGQLVQVSSTPHSAYTPCLSTF